ncbi:hypothetical protein ABZ234_08690 [Nocardiopsis sp. NPDC006198]|uniref:hypothetical protein n=1 Tax=Nocardiopsis sp. NPDC006198 TaxID=3154472 RepID=UPI0033A64831
MSYDIREAMHAATLLTAARGTGTASARREPGTDDWTITLPGRQAYRKNIGDLERVYTELAPAQRHQTTTEMVLEAVVEMTAFADDGVRLYTATRTGRSWELRTPDGDSAQVPGGIGHACYTLLWLARGSILIQDGLLIDLDL